MDGCVVIVQGMLPEGEAMSVWVVFLFHQERALGRARSGQYLGNELWALLDGDD